MNTWHNGAVAIYIHLKIYYFLKLCAKDKRITKINRDMIGRKMNRANMTSFRFDPIYLGRSEQENAINKFRKINYSLCSLQLRRSVHKSCV